MNRGASPEPYPHFISLCQGGERAGVGRAVPAVSSAAAHEAAPLPRRRPAEYDDPVKASILAALLLAWAFPAAAQTNHPDVPIPREENQIRRQNQIEELRRDQQMNDLSQQQEMARLQQQIDSLKSPPDNPDVPNRPKVNQADLNRLQQELNRLRDEQQLQRQQAEQRILQIEQQGDTARRRRWAAQFTREQQSERLKQRQRLDDIEENLRRLSK